MNLVSKNCMCEEQMVQSEKNFIGQAEIAEYKKFAFKDDMLKLSVCFILGNSFNRVVCGLSDYLIMPVMTYLMSSTGSEWREITVSPAEGLNIELGRLAGVFADFLMVSVALYLIYVKFIGRMIRRPPQENPQKRCVHCMSVIHAEAKKCPMCTGGLIVQKRRSRGEDKGTKGS